VNGIFGRLMKILVYMLVAMIMVSCSSPWWLGSGGEALKERQRNALTPILQELKGYVDNHRIYTSEAERQLEVIEESSYVVVPAYRKLVTQYTYIPPYPGMREQLVAQEVWEYVPEVRAFPVDSTSYHDYYWQAEYFTGEACAVARELSTVQYLSNIREFMYMNLARLDVPEGVWESWEVDTTTVPQDVSLWHMLQQLQDYYCH
jgi:hypothetical protein